MTVRQVPRTANVSWSPAKQSRIMLAAGTTAQQLDATFSSDAELEIFEPLQEAATNDMAVLGKVSSPHRFHCLGWGAMGIGTESLPNGLIGGGLDNGCLMLWDPSKIISGEEAVVGQAARHTGPVRALDFNPSQANIVATGGAHNSIFIYDINDLDKEMTPGDYPASSQADISHVAWNKHVPHILVSTSLDGLSVVWDLKASRPIIQFSDNGGVKNRLVAVEWSPESAMQLVTACEEDRAPVLQLWDLRQAYSPLKTMEQHTRGVLAMAWCPKDADLLVSSAKDNRTILWNPNTSVSQGEVVGELPPSTNWNFEVKWCARDPSLVACCSMPSTQVGMANPMTANHGQSEPSITVYDITAGPGAPSVQQAGSDWLGAAVPQKSSTWLAKVPKWLKRPCGASFSFGGKLARFSSDLGPNVIISTVVTEKEVAARAFKLQQALDSDQLDAFSEERLKAANQETRKIWAYLNATLKPEKRELLLDLIGYSKAAKVPNTQPAEENAAEPLVENESVAQPLVEEEQKESETGEGESGKEDERSETGEEKDDDPFKSIAQGNFASAVASEPIKISVAQDTEGQISRAVMIGDLEAATEIAMNNDMMTEALLLASLGSPSLLMKVQVACLAKNQSNLSPLLATVVKSDWLGLVANAAIDNWQEVFALLLTYARDDQLGSLAEMLGDRLSREGGEKNVAEALALYIVRGSVPKMVEAWSTLYGQPSATNRLLDFVEQVAVMAKAAGVEALDSATSAEFIRYAELVASQGQLEIANKMLRLCGNASDVDLLAERVASAQLTTPMDQPQPAKAAEVREIPAAQAQASQPLLTMPQQYPAYQMGQSGMPLQGQPMTNSHPTMFVQPPQAQPTGYSHAMAPPAGPMMNQSNAAPGSLPPPPAPSSRNYDTGDFPGMGSQPIGAPPTSLPNMTSPPNSTAPPGFPPVVSQPMSTAPPGFPPMVSQTSPSAFSSLASQPMNAAQGGFPPMAPQPMNATPGNFPPMGSQPMSTAPPGFPPMVSQTSPSAFSSMAPQHMNSASGGFPPMGAPPSGIPNTEAQPMNTTPGNFPPIAPQPMNAAPSNFPPMTPQPISTPSASYSSMGSQPMGAAPLGQPPMGQTVFQPAHGFSAPSQAPPQKSPVVKKEIPAEYQPIVDKLNGFVDTVAALPNVAARKRAEGIRTRLETLYDLMRENRVDAATVTALNQLLQALDAKNYPACMSVYNHLAQSSQSNVTWLVGIKSLFQLLQQHAV